MKNPVRIVTCKETRGGLAARAWIEVDKSFKATSTSSESAAALNVAYRHFFGTSLHRDFPDDASKVTVLQIGENLYEGIYTPGARKS